MSKVMEECKDCDQSVGYTCVGCEFYRLDGVIKQKDSEISTLKLALKELEYGLLREIARASESNCECLGCCGGADIPEEELCRACWHVKVNNKMYPLWDVEETLKRITNSDAKIKEILDTINKRGEE